ncbi:ABC transporter ATP-binding protein [Candidatus Woesearchaeota archaeon]|nr:ABC transporter ATP-binding protein [Candidatus Woesearchaeota archaeon]
MKIMEAISIKKVSKHFKINRSIIKALEDISFSIQEGEIFGILGPNGAGKTTLLNCINGMLTPDKGSIRIFGKSLLEDIDILENINFVSGESKFHWNLNARQVLKFYGMLYNIPLDVIRQRSDMLIKLLDISDFANRNFDTLSTGQRMRVVLAKVMINEPKLMLLDEPTLGLDPNIAVKVRDLILRINKEKGTTILLTSHYMSEVEQLCKRIAFLHNGRIVDIGEVEKVKLKKFNEYDVSIELRQVKNKAALEKMGFTVRGNSVSMPLSNNQNISTIISKLIKEGYHIVDMEIRKPSLEDYFIKMVK